MKPAEIFAIIEKEKVDLGMGDWTFLIKKSCNLGDSNAEIEVDIYEKVATIKFNVGFDKQDTLKQEEDIIHELVHGRHLIKEKRQEEVMGFHEEDFVNDVVRWGIKR